MQTIGMTDKGAVRSENQDTFLTGSLSEHTVYAAVFDGMGGAKAGALASSFAAAEFEKALRDIGERAVINDPGEVLLRVLDRVNTLTYEKSRSCYEYSGMGTTCVAALLYDGVGAIANVGDSRAYLFGKTGCRQITRDHSIVAALLASGEIDEKTAREHPQRNVITRAVGTDQTVEADLFPVDLTENELLLCSDGLHGYFTAKELFSYLRNRPPMEACRALTEEAKRRGGHDNITSVIVTGKER